MWQQVLLTVSCDGYNSLSLDGILRGSVIHLNLPVIQGGLGSSDAPVETSLGVWELNRTELALHEKQTLPFSVLYLFHSAFFCIQKTLAMASARTTTGVVELLLLT